MRVRPLNKDENTNKAKSILRVSEDKGQVITMKFTFCDIRLCLLSVTIVLPAQPGGIIKEFFLC